MISETQTITIVYSNGMQCIRGAIARGIAVKIVRLLLGMIIYPISFYDTGDDHRKKWNVKIIGRYASSIARSF